MHCDTPFLYEVLKRGGLIWLHQNCGFYRLHASNMSNKINLRALNSMYQFFKTKEPGLSYIVKDYKERNTLQYYFRDQRYYTQLLKKSAHRILLAGSVLYFVGHIHVYFLKLLRRLFAKVSK